MAKYDDMYGKRVIILQYYLLCLAKYGMIWHSMTQYGMVWQHIKMKKYNEMNKSVAKNL